MDNIWTIPSNRRHTLLQLCIRCRVMPCRFSRVCQLMWPSGIIVEHPFFIEGYKSLTFSRLISEFNISFPESFRPAAHVVCNSRGIQGLMLPAISAATILHWNLSLLTTRIFWFSIARYNSSAERASDDIRVNGLKLQRVQVLNATRQIPRNFVPF